MVGSATVALVVRSRSGLAALRPRAPGRSKNIPAGAAATALQKSAVLLKPRCASTLRLRERRKKRGDGRVELRLERIEGRDEGAVVGIEHVVEHGGRYAGRLGPIPVGQRELGVAAELADGGLQPADIGAVPGQKPPVLVRAVKDMNEGVAVPVARIRRRPVQHFTDPLLVAVEDARRHSRIGDLEPAKPRALRRRGGRQRACRQRGGAGAEEFASRDGSVKQRSHGIPPSDRVADGHASRRRAAGPAVVDSPAQGRRYAVLHSPSTVIAWRMIPLVVPIAFAVLALFAWRYDARARRAYEATLSEAEKRQFRALRRVQPAKWRAAIALKQAETAATAAPDVGPRRPKKRSPKPIRQTNRNTGARRSRDRTSSED